MNYTEIRNLLNNLNPDDLCALLLYGEARGELPIGQIAVIHVALNRAKKGGWFGKGLTGERGVILKPFQFSCFNENDPNLPKMVSVLSTPNAAFHRCQGIVSAVLHGNTPDPTNGATHYHTIAKPKSANKWPPVWAAQMTKTATLGSHIFYK